MLLTLSTTHQPATDLGFLLHKHPDKLHEVTTSHGKVYMFYPQADTGRCTFALTLEIDPVALVRRKGKPQQAGLLDQYVNDRPYAASSFLTVAMGRTLNTAFAGRSKERQALADTPIPLEASLAPLPVRGTEDLPQQLFTPLGYQVSCETHPLIPGQPAWGDSRYITLTLSATVRLQDLLEHLFVLIPVMDNRKHYYIDQAELEKLLRKGETWLQQHPAKELITRRYLKNRAPLVREALARLADDEPASASNETERPPEQAEEQLEQPLNLHATRLETVTQTLLEHGAEKVLDLGCGEGRLLQRLMQERRFTRMTGVDISIRSLEIASRRLKLEQLPERQRQRLQLLQGALTYRDARFSGFDAITLVEVIEHLEPDRLPALERTVFEFAHPAIVVVTTPNREYNALIASLPAGQLRHADHRFEWTRAEFAAWCQRVADTFGYQLSISFIGPGDAQAGGITQMGVFSR